MSNPYANHDDAVFAAMFPEEAARERAKVSPPSVADDDETTAGILAQSVPGYSDERRDAQAQQQQAEREDRPLSRQEIDDAEVFAGMFGDGQLSERERAAIDERRTERQLAEDAHKLERQRTRLDAHRDTLAHVGAQLGEMQRVVGSFDTPEDAR